MVIRNERVKPVREQLLELGFKKVAGGVYKRESDKQIVHILPPANPADVWRTTEINL